RDMSDREVVGMFVYTLAQGVGNMAVQDRFQHSRETVRRYFYNVLQSVNRMAKNIIKPRDLTFQRVSDKIRYDYRYWLYFRGCIGAIDGTHILVIVPSDEKTKYVGRKGVPTQNVMAICDFDMLFTFVCAGWEGTAHDSRILNSV